MRLRGANANCAGVARSGQPDLKLNSMKTRLQSLATFVLLTLLTLLPASSRSAEPPVAAGEVILFGGEDLTGWEITDFAGHGEVRVEEGKLMLDMGAGLTGVKWTNAVPARMNYELELEAMRVSGFDFFCGLTFPVNDSSCSLILGGWGGGVTGISCIDGYDASMNETTGYRKFDAKKWYQVKVRVTPDRLLAWLDGQEIVNVEHAGRKIDVRLEMESAVPLGIASWQTDAAIRNVRLRPVK